MKTGFLIALSLTTLSAACGAEAPTVQAPTWSVSTTGDILAAAYGTDQDRPQYAALHLDSGYLRLVSGPSGGWGTSIVVVPSLWTGTKYYQGARVTANPTITADLLLTISGSIQGLNVAGEIRLHPPTGNSITADVHITTTGSVPLDTHACEAFKPLLLSSMHISADEWDTQSAKVDNMQYAIPKDQWIVPPPCPTGSSLTLLGGTSKWKTNAPNVAVTLAGSPYSITGWVTSSLDHNSDNVAFWAATDKVLSSWSYSITAELPK